MEKKQRPCWIRVEVFQELIAHWNSEKFKEISEKAKKNRASEAGGCNYASGSISVAEVARRMVRKFIYFLINLSFRF